MTLQELFKQLTYGELSQLSIGGSEAGEINKKNYSRVVAHVNLGLTAIYKRFCLKEASGVVVLVSNQSMYPLTLILPDLLKVEQVLTLEKCELPLNDKGSQYSVFTPTYKNLKVPLDIANKAASLPDVLKTSSLEIVYRANHRKLGDEDGYVDPEDEELELPDSHVEALLYFIASRVNNPIGMTGEFNAGNNYAAKYERECQRLEMENLQVDQGIANHRLQKQGWV